MVNVHKFIRTYGRFILPTILFLASAGILFYGVIPAFGTLRDKYAAQNTLNEENNAIKKRVETLEALDERILRDQVTSLMTAIPANKSLPTVLTTLDAVAVQTGVTLTDLTIANGGSLSTQSAQLDRSKEGNVVTLKITANGQLEQVKNFMDTLVSVRRLLRINKFRAIMLPDNAVGGEFEISAFYEPLPKSLGIATAQIEPFTANEEEMLAKIATFPLISQELAQYDTFPPVEYGTKPDPFSLQ
jgi:hypothetical protein